MARTKKQETLIIERKPVQYEMVAIFKPFLPDKVRNEADAKVEEIINGVKGKVKIKDIWGKRYFAYEIAGHVEGYYVMYQFEAPGAGLDTIKKQLNLHPEVLRYLILKKDAYSEVGPKMKVKRSITSEGSTKKDK